MQTPNNTPNGTNMPKDSTHIKICGITRQADAELAIALGADALGFVFYEKSKRFVQAHELTWIKNLPPFVQLTGLFVNPTAEFVRETQQRLPIDLLQFHGDELPEFCTQFSTRYVKAVPMQGKTAAEASQYMAQYPDASGFLLDNYGTTEIGGSGAAFDWTMIPEHSPAPLIMAGGLTVDNVGEVIEHCQPYAVDVSSGVEREPGIKCPEKMRHFIQTVKTR